MSYHNEENTFAAVFFQVLGFGITVIIGLALMPWMLKGSMWLADHVFKFYFNYVDHVMGLTRSFNP